MQLLYCIEPVLFVLLAKVDFASTMIYEKRPLQQLNLQVIEQYREGSPTVPKNGRKKLFQDTMRNRKSPTDTSITTRMSFSANQQPEGKGRPTLQRSKSLPINFRHGTASKEGTSSDNKALFWFRPNPEKPLLETRAVTPVHKLKAMGHRRARTDVPRELSLPTRHEEVIVPRSQTSERFETTLYQEDSLLSFAFTSISFDGDEEDEDDEIQGLDLLGEGVGEA